MNNMELLEHVVLKVPCATCGDDYDVPIRHVLESHELIHEFEQMWDEVCPNYCREAPCELIHYAALVDERAAHDVVRSLTRAFGTLEKTGLDVDLACG